MARPVLIALAATALAALGCGGDDDGGAALPAASESVSSADTGAARASRPRRRGAVVKVVDSQFGRVVADRRGEALYLFDLERRPRSRCYGDCAVAWPPLLTKGKPRAGRGAAQRLLGTTRRRDGRLQVTYRGHPLYYYKDDEPGRILCHDVEEFGGLWLVVDPKGNAVS
jgi:predicted lipoprotein with Yx(FWY)xxD motif